MPRVFSVADDGPAVSLDGLIDGLCATGFDPGDEENLEASAQLLRGLGHDRDFLGDIIVEELAARHREEQDGNAYGAQSLMLLPPGKADFFIRANLWPSRDEYMMRASGGEVFVYDIPHDHNFHFLTLGYFGPGYWSDYYEFAYEEVVGWRGEPVDLRFVERSRLHEGKVMLYRAYLDVHRQIPPDALSVSVNIMHTSGIQGWMDQYAFDVEKGQVKRILSGGSSEAFLRIAVGLGGDEAMDLAERFARGHPSDRMRLTAWSALAASHADPAARDAVWSTAERSGSRLVEAEARLHRHALGRELASEIAG